MTDRIEDGKARTPAPQGVFEKFVQENLGRASAPTTTEHCGDVRTPSTNAAHQGEPGDRDVHKPGKKPSAVDSMLTGLVLVDGQKVEQVKTYLSNLQDRAYSSRDAAAVHLAYELASDPNLVDKITNANSEITRKTMLSTLTADAGAKLSQAQGEAGYPTILTDSQRRTLEHAISDFGTAKLNKIHSGILPNFTSEEIAKSIADSVPLTDSTLAKLAKQFEYANEAVRVELLQDGSRDVKRTTDVTAQTPHIRSTTTNPIDQSRFAEVAKEVIAKIDTQHTGYVTKEQLARAMQDPSFTGEQAQVLAAMYYQFDKLHNLSKHEGELDSQGITAFGLDIFQQMQREQQQKVADAFEMKDWALKNLAKYAHDGNNLSLDDIRNALHNPQLPAEDRHALELIEKNYSQITADRSPPTGLNVKDLEDNIKHLFKENPEAKLVAYVAQACWRVANEAQKAGTCSDLYATPNPLDSIKPGDVRQGKIGSCYFEAALAAVAQAHPELIRDAITDNHDGTYTVRFPGAKGEPITVKAPTEAELGLYSAGSKDGIWAAIMVKAYGQYKINHGYSGNVPTEGAGTAGDPSDALKLLTGDSLAHDTLVWGNDQTMANIAQLLQDAFSSHPPLAVTATIQGDMENRTADGFQNYHVYTIQGFIPDGKGGGTVVVRNPYGGQDGTPEGTIQIPLSVFMKNFTFVTTATIPVNSAELLHKFGLH